MTDKNWLPDWAVDMARVPFDPNAERAAFNFAIGGPTGMIPRNDAARSQSAPAPAQANSSGWAHEVPLTNPPGTNYVDALCDAQDRRDRAQAQPSAAEKMLVMAQAVMAQQAAIMKLLLDQSRTKTPKPKRMR
jgi:hypothetical protein